MVGLVSSLKHTLTTSNMGKTKIKKCPRVYILFQHLSRLKVNRNTWAVPYCLALKTTPHFADFSSQPFVGGMHGLVPQDASPELLVKDSETFKTQCFPLFTMLQAIGNPKVNLFILDIEGAEFEVLIYIRIGYC